MIDLRQAAEMAWNYFRNVDDITVEGKQVMEALRQALAQPKREWVGLTDADIAQAMHGSVEGSNILPYQFARAIEAKLKEKNT